MKIKNLLLLLVIGLLIGLASPKMVDAFILNEVIITTSIDNGEDNIEVDPIEPTPDYDEGTHTCTDAQQVHYHYNTSEDPSSGDFWEIVHEFAIVLDTDYPGGSPAINDFWENVDTTTLLCTDGGSFDADGDGDYESRYQDCGFDKNTIREGTVIMTVSGGRWSGVSVTYDTLDWIDGNPRGLIWKYGTSDITDVNIKPWLASGGSKKEGVSFELENYYTDQTVTTESWTKSEFYFFENDGDYYHTYPEEVDGDRDGNDEETNVDSDGDYIFWYGLNGRARSIFPACEPTPITCADLEITPDSLNVSDVFSDTEFSLTATGSDGTNTYDITDDVEITYQAFDFDGGPSTGDIRYRGASNISNGNNGPVSTNDTEIEYRNSEPGDMLTAYVSDYEGDSYEEACSVYVEWPYCEELNITNPSSRGFIATGEVDIPVEYEAYASSVDGTGNPEAWPYSVTYSSTDANATFDANRTPYTADPGANVASYQSSESATVTVEAENDVAGSCSEDFTYGIRPEIPVCESLEIIIPSSETLTCEEMSEKIKITWESFMTSGAPTTGPWLVTSSNPAGTFSLTPAGPTVGTGTYLVTAPPMVVYYLGEGGDAIQIVDRNYPGCFDSIDSETCEDVAPVCEDLTLGEPYITTDGGITKTPIDLTDDADLETLYANSTVCWDYTLNVTDPSYSARLIANGFSDRTRTAHTGNLSLTMNETAGSTTGNPSNLAFTGFASYTGTLCWENYEAGNELSMFVLGDQMACHDSEILPPPETPEVPVCVDLQMSPDSYTMSAADVDAGNIPVIISVQGSDATWTGTLIVEHTGTGALFYSDGSPSLATDGHLEIPVSGTTFNVTVFYRNGHAGDIVSSSVRSQGNLCNDVFTITQTPPGQICEDLELTPDSVTMEADATDAGTINGKVVVTGSGSEWTGTLIITKNGAGTLHYADGSNSTYNDGRLEIAVAGGSSTETFTYTGGQADDVVRAYIQNDSALCSDEFPITQDIPETPVCEEIEFPDEIQTYNCEDVPDVELCMDRDEDDQREVEICYEAQNGDDGEWEYNGRTYEGCEEIIIAFEAGETRNCVDLTFNEVCEGSKISVNEAGEVCEEMETEEVEVGAFEKFIYTFNFASEKNSYTDEGVFFSHDEDRAFYTLDYNPAGEEEAITFTDEMWGSDLEGKNGDGSDSGGNVRLATTYNELVEGNSGVYDYKLITKMGFGHAQEWYSDDLAAYVDSAEFQNNFKTFIPYVQYPLDIAKRDNLQSVLIEACEYDEDDNLESEGVCYDPDHSPTTTNDVVIENAGTVQEDYGVEASIRIRYVGVIDSGLDCGDNADGCLTEEFENTASVEAFDNLASLTDSARLVVLCSYLMTQNAGDVYLEVSLQGGSDIACIFVDEDETTSSDYRNVDSLIILNGDNNQNDTDDEFMSSYSGSTVSFCDDDEDNLIGNLSSYVCEIVAKVSDLWAKTNVETTTSSHLSQATRNADTDQVASSSTYASWDELTYALTNNNNPNSNILYFDASQSNDGKMTLGKLEVPAGAWTVIVEGGDLVLTGNITYAATSNISDYKNLPSVAFVVQDGDIYIDDRAAKLVGVYYTNQKFDGDERSAVDEQLTVEGSFYGNIQTLIERAKYVGPPTIDGGGIVIKYDSRIILNTPPALSDYVDISTEKGVN